ARPVPLPFPIRTPSTRKSEMDEDLLQMFKKVEIKILLLHAIKDPGIFLVPCTISGCTFVDAMLNLGASINVMPTSVYKSLKFRDLGPMGMTIQLANRSTVQPLGILEDVLVQVNDLIFLVDFYVLNMEDETSGKGSALIMGRPFLMTAKTKINVYVGTLSMEFEDNLVQFNIFEGMQHPIKDHSLSRIDVIDELVEKHTQLDPTELKLLMYNEEPKYSKHTSVPVAETDKPIRVQVATITISNPIRPTKAGS
ncbi:hypothetical protein CR513_12321, partial [Mucuna pruriens]